MLKRPLMLAPPPIGRHKRVGLATQGPMSLWPMTIVTTLLLTAMVAPPVGLESCAVKLSASSSAVSLVVATLKDLLALSPSAHDSVPLAAVKSAPEVALPSTVA